MDVSQDEPRDRRDEAKKAGAEKAPDEESPEVEGKKRKGKAKQTLENAMDSEKKTEEAIQKAFE